MVTLYHRISREQGIRKGCPYISRWYMYFDKVVGSLSMDAEMLRFTQHDRAVPSMPPMHLITNTNDFFGIRCHDEVNNFLSRTSMLIISS